MTPANKSTNQRGERELYKDKKVVITYGTFDLFHKGHYNILKRAKELGDYLIVGVTGEAYDAERGKLSVRDSLVKRIENVKNSGFADEIIVEEYLGQKIQHIIQYNVDVLVVGSDWKGKFDHMRKYCEVVYLERTKDISSTMLREEGDIYKLGIVTDSAEDDDMVIESKYVSGIHVESVYSDEEQLAKEFCNDFELDSYYTDYSKFLESVEIIYINTVKDKKYHLIKEALENDKVVISSPVVADSIEKIEELYKFAADNKKILIECVPTFYLQAYMQLMWNAKGQQIGDLICVKNSIRLGELVGIDKDDIDAHLYFTTLFAKQIVGDNAVFDKKQVGQGDNLHILYTGENGECIYSCELGNSPHIKSDMKIIGTEGTINVPANWWETGYFELKRNDDSNIRRHSCNYSGNGMRYVLVSVLSKIKENKHEDMRLTPEEVLYAAKIVKGF